LPITIALFLLYMSNVIWGKVSMVLYGYTAPSTYNNVAELAKVPAARGYAMAELAAVGVKFYSPTPDELQLWKDAAGHQLPIWDDTKKELAGSLETFNKLFEAANTQGKYYVHDV
jgi:hypothetical protein